MNRLDNQSTSHNLGDTIQTHTHDGINSQRLYVNILRVYSVVPTFTADNGTVVLYDNKVDTRAIYTMLGGVWYSTLLT